MTKKKIYISLLGLLGIYILTYVVLTSFGGYAKRLTISGGTWYSNSGLGIPDQQLWEPIGFNRRPASDGLLEAIYYPMSAIDDLVWHKPIRI